jgi:hypothetical protein
VKPDIRQPHRINRYAATMMTITAAMVTHVVFATLFIGSP